MCRAIPSRAHLNCLDFCYVVLCRQAKAAMQAFNVLIDRVAADEAYLTDTLTKAAKQDPFTGGFGNRNGR